MTQAWPAEPELDAWLAGLRPRLHRYCARMTGSAIDGEDVVQEALLKALEAGGAAVARPEAWLFRIAHNAALDFLRRRTREAARIAEAELADLPDPTPASPPAADSLRAFLALTPAERSCTILMDVLGHSLAEVAAETGMTLPAVKAALHRGRGRLREAPREAPPPALSPADRARLQTYADLFNRRDFDGLRARLADDVRLELVSRFRVEGRETVGSYFGNYAAITDWRAVPAEIEGRAALAIHAPDDPSGPPLYVILLSWRGDQVAAIRDFRYARYVTADVAPRPTPPPAAA